MAQCAIWLRLLTFYNMQMWIVCCWFIHINRASVKLMLHHRHWHRHQHHLSFSAKCKCTQWITTDCISFSIESQTILWFYSLESISCSLSYHLWLGSSAPHARHDCDLFATYVAYSGGFTRIAFQATECRILYLMRGYLWLEWAQDSNAHSHSGADQPPQPSSSTSYNVY